MSELVPTLDTLHAELLHLASQTLSDGRPAFLFRGEPDLYPTTLSSMDRYYPPNLEASAYNNLTDQELEELDALYEELDNLTAFCMTMPLREDRLPAKLAGAFAQHYRLPTQVFDFTASADVAVNFAANRPWYRKPWPRFGRMGILDIAKADASGHVELFDLRTFDDAIRARRQAAFGLIYSAFIEDDHVDLKRPEIAGPLGLEWRVFAHLPDDEAYLHATTNDTDLEDVTGDLAAAIPQQMIDLYVLTHGPLSLKAAEILSKRVPAVGYSPEDNQVRWSGGADAIR